MSRKRRDCEMPPTVVMAAKRNYQPETGMSHLDTVKKRIVDGVNAVDPNALRQALTVRTRLEKHISFSFTEKTNIYRRLIRPSRQIYSHKREELLECLRLIVADERFDVPDEYIDEVIEDDRQLHDIVKVLLNESPTKSFTCKLLGYFAYLAMVKNKLKDLEVIIQHSAFIINKLRDFHTRFLSFALSNVDGKSFNALIVPVLLAHPDIDPNLRSDVGDVGEEYVWQSPLCVANDSYVTATANSVERVATVAVKHVHQLLQHDNIDIHSILDEGHVGQMELDEADVGNGPNGEQIGAQGQEDEVEDNM